MKRDELKLQSGVRNGTLMHAPNCSLRGPEMKVETQPRLRFTKTPEAHSLASSLTAANIGG